MVSCDYSSLATPVYCYFYSDYLDILKGNTREMNIVSEMKELEKSYVLM